MTNHAYYDHLTARLKKSTSALYRLALVLILGVLLPVQTYASSNDSLLIRNVIIVSADATLSKKPLNVMIKNGRIQAISTAQYSADKVIDGQGQYLIPGLIDTHVHLSGVPGFTGNEDTKVYQQALAQIPRSYLYAGFTTLLDLANTKQFITQWNQQPLAPQAYFCAPAPIPQGYPIATLPEEIQLKVDAARYYLHDDHHAHPISQNSHADPHKPAQLVAAIKEDGALCVKIYYEKGFGKKRNLPVPSKAITRELVAAAHQKKLPVFLHGNSQESYEFALATDVDMLVHGLWHANANSTPADLTQIAKRLASANIAVQPTVQVLYGEQELFNPDFFQEPYIKQVMPASLIAWYQSEAGQWMKQEIGEYFGKDSILTDQQKYQQVKAVYQPMLKNIQIVSSQLAQQKPLLIFGSDTPSGPIYTQFPGLNGRQEMQRWIDMGISLPKLFQAMTIGNAKKIGLDRNIGSVATNKAADLLLLSKNPLTDITAYDSINWVILKGKPIARTTLSALHTTQ